MTQADEPLTMSATLASPNALRHLLLQRTTQGSNVNEKKKDSVVRFVHVSLQSSSHLDLEISVSLWMFRIQDRTSQTVSG